jgi:lipopolysaccharide export system protein LptC
MTRVSAGVIALLALAAVTAWLQSGQSRDSDAMVPVGPEWYFTDASLTATDADGTIAYRIDAPRIAHEPTDDTALLESPRLEWLQGGGPPLVITAALGRADADTQRVALSGGVAVVDDSTGTRLEFRSADLLVDADARIASTRSPVQVASVHGELHAVGLTADMNAGTIRLESSVRGRYVP